MVREWGLHGLASGWDGSAWVTGEVFVGVQLDTPLIFGARPTKLKPLQVSVSPILFLDVLNQYLMGASTE
jgi:hypothetical protein